MENNQELHLEQDFWNDFILEAFEHIDDIETNVLTLEKNPEDMEIIHTMFRAFHTIKGLSGFVEHTIIQEIAHKTETLMDYCRKGELKVDTAIVDAILKSSDYIKRLCEDIESYKDNSFIEQISSHIDTLEALSNVGEAPTAEIPQAAPGVETPVVEEQPQEPSVEIVEVTAEETAKNVVVETPEQEMLKAKADELAKLFEEDSDAEEQKQEQEQEQETEKTVEETSQEQEVPAAEIITPATEVEVHIGPPPAANNVPESIQPAKPENPVESGSVMVATKVAPEKTETAEPAKKVVAAPEEHMKVANSKIDHLVEMIGELIISQSLIEQYTSSRYAHDNQLIQNMSGFLRITRELQSLSMSLRMVSLKPTFQKVSRIARDTIQELKKDVEVVITGESTEIDRVVTDKLLDPLVHLIKNAISHGVEESPEDRVKLGKSRRAKVELNAYSKRGKIFIEIKDDGRGIDTEVVYNKALEKGLVDKNKTYSEEEIREFILLPGFSTAKVVDNISGRGVGMDVVKTQILKIGGKVNIESEIRKGSTFTLEVPVNHAIMNGTVIEIREQYFIIPTINVKEILQPEDKQWIFTQQKRTMLRVRDDIIPMVPISLFFKGAKLEENVPLVMLLELNGELKALPITNVINRQEVVVKPLGEEFAHLKYISGMSILGTGKVSLILDIDYLFKKEVKE